MNGTVLKSPRPIISCKRSPKTANASPGHPSVRRCRSMSPALKSATRSGPLNLVRLIHGWNRKRVSQIPSIRMQPRRHGSSSRASVLKRNRSTSGCVRVCESRSCPRYGHRWKSSVRMRSWQATRTRDLKPCPDYRSQLKCPAWSGLPRSRSNWANESMRCLQKSVMNSGFQIGSIPRACSRCRVRVRS